MAEALSQKNPAEIERARLLKEAEAIAFGYSKAEPTRDHLIALVLEVGKLNVDLTDTWQLFLEQSRGPAGIVEGAKRVIQ